MAVPEKNTPKKTISSQVEVIIKNNCVFTTKESISYDNYHIYLLERIGDLKYYSEVCTLLRLSGPEDDITIYLNNFGGSLHTTFEIVNAMRASRSPIRVIVTGPVYSAAPLIALSAEEIILEDHTFMMFHDYSGEEGGKGSEMEASIIHFRPFWKNFVATTCKGFLTNKEIKDILSGKDIYLNREACVKRLKKLKKFREVDTINSTVARINSLME